MSITDNPRAVVGDNRAPDYAQRVTNELREQYRETERRVELLVSRANGLPDIVDDASMGPWAQLIKEARDEAKRLDALREAEKQPHLRASQAVDGFFFPLYEQLVRKNRMSKPGLADVLQRGLDDYNQRKLHAELERRRQAAEVAAREERERLAEQDRLRREAEDARLRAERARKDITGKEAIAGEAETAAAVAQSAAEQASVAAEDARIATLAKPADIVRTRVEEGPVVTMAAEPFAVVEDYAALDKNALWPFVTRNAIEQALRAWARTTNYGTQMPGARVGRRPKTVVR
jgi:hypothetical protein